MATDQTEISKLKHNPVVHYTLQLLALALLLWACYEIIAPFITLLVWASVLAITLYPLQQMIARRIGGRNGWAAAIVSVLMLSILIVPAVWLLFSTVSEFKEIAELYRAGQFNIPPPPDRVKEWPVIGKQMFDLWTAASTNLTALITEHTDQVKAIALKGLDLLANTGKGILLFTLAVILSGVLLAFAKPAGELVKSLFVKLTGEMGASMTQLAELTVRNVAKGILGVAVIQSLLAGIGFVLAGIPLAGVWIVICLILSIVQLGLLPVSVGVIIYIWGHGSTLTAVLLTVWMIFVGLIDNVLKPIMLGKGAPVPMLVVFVGAIGGFMSTGFIGLFTGAIILSVGYKLFNAWINSAKQESTEEEKLST
jgi:predicted PurR-regulated permease PerM